MLLTQTTKGKSSATSHNQTRYMVLLVRAVGVRTVLALALL